MRVVQQTHTARLLIVYDNFSRATLDCKKSKPLASHNLLRVVVLAVSNFR